MTTAQIKSAIDEFDYYRATVPEVAFIPPPLIDGLRHYLYGRPTGDFLRAVLSNDLAEAVGRAHETSLAAIGPLVRLIHNAMPGICHGSQGLVEAWLRAAKKTREMEASHAN